jgi:hypothetical protein
MSSMRSRLRARLLYLALAAATIGVGLSVHRHGTWLTPVGRDVLGDALWAVMILWGVSAVAPAASRAQRGGVALAVCWAVECSQLYHTTSLDALRDTTAGQLVLGSGFDPRDLAAYAAGIVVAALLDAAVGRRRSRERSADMRRRAAT